LPDGAAPVRSIRTVATSAAEVAQARAVTAKTAAAPAVWRRSPASAGAMNRHAPTTVPDATLAAVSSAGVLASDGMIEPWVGLVSVIVVAVRAAAA
jgi:hypothetical protein